MSRRSATTIQVRVTLQLPAGASVGEAIQYIWDAVRAHKGGLPLDHPMASVQPEAILVKLEKRETTYL